MSLGPKAYVVEHLDPELGPWSTLEYKTIAQETWDAGAWFRLSSVPNSLRLPRELINGPGFTFTHLSVEEVYATRKDKVCLLDPAAAEELSVGDGDVFEVFLFGGILGRGEHGVAVVIVD